MIERKADGEEIVAQAAGRGARRGARPDGRARGQPRRGQGAGGGGKAKARSRSKPKPKPKAKATPKQAEGQEARHGCREEVGRVPARRAVEVEVEGRRLTLTNLDKVLYPEAGFTKGQVIDYYTRVAPVLLPHLRGRALTLKRYPDGVDGKYFYEKQSPSHAPEWVRERADPGRGPQRSTSALRRPADARLAGEPRRPRAAPVAGAGRRPGRARPCSSSTSTRARRPRIAECCRGGAARCATLLARAGAGVLPEDVRLEGHAALRAAQHHGDLRRDQAVRARARADARARAPRLVSR